jgi:2'-5' RNA ligase
MYLISIYFDEETNSRIKTYMKSIVKATGNTAMLDGEVPPHVTIAAFRAQSERSARDIFLKGAELAAGESIQWISCGSFFRELFTSLLF